VNISDVKKKYGLSTLVGAELRFADLSGADLWKADLRYADLWKADLSGADLSGADLSGADLRFADLSGADLRDTDLRGADLRDTDLQGANLRGANTSKTCLSEGVADVYIWVCTYRDKHGDFHIATSSLASSCRDMVGDRQMISLVQVRKNG
jgi:uncharacterized protein YjbI with pentapeptide repeats